MSTQYVKGPKSPGEEVVIEKNVPIAPARNGRRGHFAGFFDRIDVGDSVVLEGKQRGHFTKYMQRKGRGFATRLIETDGVVRRYRCWCLDNGRAAQ